MDLVRIVRKLSRDVGRLSFAPPTDTVYNPLEYARKPAEEYLRRYAHEGVEALFLGMNPGPYGMAQTGVPFGEVASVRDWLAIEGKVGKPDPEHPKRPIVGFDCTRSEVSGARVWGWARERFATPDDFFRRFFVWNYCPLVFMEETGRNRTPDKLPAAEREPLYAACDDAVRKVVKTIAPGRVIGVGAFAQKRAREILDDDVQVDVILHPSPASPIANRGWAPQAEAQLRAMGISL